MTAVRAAMAGCGAAIMAYAVAGALSDPDVSPVGVLVFLGAVLVAHDALWMPAVLLLGVAVTRLAPLRYRALVQALAVILAILGMLALPLVLGVGRVPDNPSVQPLPYGRNLTLVVLVVTGGVFLGVVADAVARRVRTATARTDPPPSGPRPGPQEHRDEQ